MQKIISLFQRNYDGARLVRSEVVPGAEWVLRGEGVATQKFDGTACLISSEAFFKRHEIKRGRPSPAGFVPASGVDPITGKQQGWVPVGDGPEDQWHWEAFDPQLPNGTYELCGPKVQGNPEGFENHRLVRHGAEILENVPRDFEGLKIWFAEADVEGIVWHHDDGRMVKIKARDFGIRRKARELRSGLADL